MLTKFAELRVLWRMVRTIVLIVGVLLTFFAGLELVRAYNALRDLHPWAGYGFLIVLGGSLGAVVIYVVGTLARRPPVLRPPVGRVATASRRWLRRYCRYLARYLCRLSVNENLSEEARARAQDAVGQILIAGGAGKSAGSMRTAIAEVEEKHIQPLLEILDERAEAVVRHSVRDIMIGVALSPYRALDVLVVVYRSTAMVAAVVRTYSSRPRLRELLMTFRDTLRIVATVNYLNIGQKFIERLFSAVPFIGRFMDELSQGFGAGLLTSVAGHAAIDRCRAYREWNHEEAALGIGQKLGEFMGDVKDMFTEDVLPHMRRRAKARGEEKADEPGFWDKIKSAVEKSADEVADWVGRPEEEAPEQTTAATAPGQTT